MASRFTRLYPKVSNITWRGIFARNPMGHGSNGSTRKDKNYLRRSVKIRMICPIRVLSFTRTAQILSNNTNMNNAVQLTAITFNIQADFLSHKDIPSWDERRTLCAQALRQAQPSLIGLQEVRSKFGQNLVKNPLLNSCRLWIR